MNLYFSFQSVYDAGATTLLQTPEAALMPTPYADLDIRLRPHHSGGYAVDLRFSRSDSETLDETESELPVAFDLEALRAAEHDPAGYGQAPTDSLFADPLVREKFLAVTNSSRRRPSAFAVPRRSRTICRRVAPSLENWSNCLWSA
jgi:hypothetical protein